MRRIRAIGAALLILLPSSAAAEPTLKAIAPGLEFGLISAEQVVRWGGSDLACLRVDPKRYTFKVLAAPPGASGYIAGEWRTRSGALAVFNAGQYATDGTYLGLLVQNGVKKGRLASRLEALFAAEPFDASLPWARVIDLRYTAYDAKHSPYRQVAQSLMLLDRFGHVRVRRSPRVAHRTLVAQDAAGRILVLVSEGGHTLWELARFLAGAGLGLREVMCMDGGAESQLALAVEGFRYEHYGDPTAGWEIPLPWPKAPLPVALGLFKRQEAKKDKTPPGPGG